MIPADQVGGRHPSLFLLIIQQGWHSGKQPVDQNARRIYLPVQARAAASPPTPHNIYSCKRCIFRSRNIGRSPFHPGRNIGAFFRTHPFSSTNIIWIDRIYVVYWRYPDGRMNSLKNAWRSFSQPTLPTSSGASYPAPTLYKTNTLYS